LEISLKRLKNPSSDFLIFLFVESSILLAFFSENVALYQDIGIYEFTFFSSQDLALLSALLSISEFSVDS